MVWKETCGSKMDRWCGDEIQEISISHQGGVSRFSHGTHCVVSVLISVTTTSLMTATYVAQVQEKRPLCVTAWDWASHL